MNSQHDAAAGIPVIDLASCRREGRLDPAALAPAVGAACRDVGFFVLSNHGVPQTCMDAAFRAAHEVFDLPSTAKAPLAMSARGGNRGYVGLGVEALEAGGIPDRKEAYNLVWTDGSARGENLWPAIPGWRDRAQAYFDAVLALGRQLHEAFALDLGIDRHFFDDKLDQPMATLRFLHYPPGLPDTRGAGTHTDYGNLTLLATDGVAGLQVRDRGGRWIEVPPLASSFVCNVGDCLMRWTNDVYVSTPHRVRPPDRDRYSIALFVDPNPEAWVAPLASCIPPGETARYAPISAQAHIDEKLAATYAHRRPIPS